MQCYTHTLPGGASLVGYLREETTEMPAFNTRPAMLILPGGGYAYCSSREADPVAMQFLQAGYNVFILYYTCRGQESQPALRWQPFNRCGRCYPAYPQERSAVPYRPGQGRGLRLLGGRPSCGVHGNPVGR